MTKATKQEKKGGSELNKQSVVIQKGISRSGRAIKPKTFGDMVTETIIKVDDKRDVLKTAKKVVKKETKNVQKKKVAGEKKKDVTKTQAKSPKPDQKLSPKSSPIPEGFTPVDITAIISAKQQTDGKPKTVVAKVVAVSQPNKVNSVPKTIVLSPKSPVPKQLTFEEREKEIQALRARLKKLEAEHEAEKKARAKTNNVSKAPEKVAKKTVAKPVAVPKVANATTDDRPARVKKPTWKAMEQE